MVRSGWVNYSQGWQRWKPKLTIAAIIFGFMWAIFFPLLTTYEIGDMKIFLDAGAGRSLTGYYYAPWILPLIGFIDAIFPFKVASIILNCLSLSGYLYALHVFKGSKGLFFISFPLLFALFYGQVDGIFMFGFALAYTSLRQDKVLPASIGLFIALCKWYIFAPFAFALWLLVATPKQRIQLVGLLSLYLGISLMVWWMWPLGIIERLRAVAPITTLSVDLWDIVGPWCLLLWIPPLLSRTRDLRWWVMTWALTTPYLHIHGLTHIMVFPLEGWGWWIQSGYVFSALWGPNNAYYLMLVPIAVYLLSWSRSWRTDLLGMWLISRNTTKNGL